MTDPQSRHRLAGRTLSSLGAAPSPAPAAPRPADLDDLPDPVSTLRSPTEWKKLRRQPAPDARRVSDAALDWMSGLPKALRPQHTTLEYPHVINMLSMVWGRSSLLATYFDDLLQSRRRQRAGFPAPVKAELEALLDWARRHGKLG